MLWQQNGPPGVGVQPARRGGTFIGRKAVSRGEVLMMDLLLSDGDVTNLTVGDRASGFSNCVAPSAAAINALAPFPIVIAKADAADDGEFDGVTFGLVQASVDATVAVGDLLEATTAGALSPAATSGDAIVAIATGARTGAGIVEVFVFGTALGTFVSTAFS